MPEAKSSKKRILNFSGLPALICLATLNRQRADESLEVVRTSRHPLLRAALWNKHLAQLPDLATRERLVRANLDPACGSGAFLHEALRTLRRADFKGRVFIKGRDTSGPAVAMAFDGSYSKISRIGLLQEVARLKLSKATLSL